MMRSLAVHPGIAELTAGFPDGWFSHLASPTTETNRQKVFFWCLIISYYTVVTIISHPVMLRALLVTHCIRHKYKDLTIL